MTSTTDLQQTAVWRECERIPDVLADVAAGPEGGAETAAVLRSGRRVVVTGNGAAYYAALALWTATLEHPGQVDCVAVPAGMLATGHCVLRPDDVLLVVSSSGELRDVVGLLGDRLPSRWALITSNPDSTLGTAATAVTVVPIRSQGAVTHSQAFVGNVLAALMVWRDVVARDLGFDPGRVAQACADAVLLAPAWSAAVAPNLASVGSAIAFGSGGGWPGALETALLFKEVAGIATEGMETREGATSGMYALRPGHAALSLAAPDDAWAVEAEDVCRRTGATVVRIPGAERGPAVLVPLTTFPASLALATSIGLASGLDVDHPSWTAEYYATARSQ